MHILSAPRVKGIQAVTWIQSTLITKYTWIEMDSLITTQDNGTAKLYTRLKSSSSIHVAPHRSETEKLIDSRRRVSVIAPISTGFRFYTTQSWELITICFVNCVLLTTQQRDVIPWVRYVETDQEGKHKTYQLIHQLFL